jgi:hypothetical protein
MSDHPNRRSFVFFMLGGFLAVTYLPAADVAAGLPPTFEGLVKVDSKKLAAVYLLPGADFRGYSKVMIDPVQVSFRKGWQKDMNMRRGASRRISDEDAQEIAKAVRSGFGEIFADAFKAKGYEVVTTPAPDVLRLSPAIVNLYINAPDPMGGAAITRTYTVEAGEATLSLEARDSTTGALLGVAVDRRATRNTGRLEFTSSISNRSEFEQLFKRWADICVNGLEELKTRPQSRIPQREKMP